jgi:DNA-binding CsgD family transcriptional regulator
VALIGRDLELAELARHADRARRGGGAMVIVSGESGAGKTAFVEEFLRGRASGGQTLWGFCDPLATPRPLGPIHDLADRFGTATRQALTDSTQGYEIFGAVFAELAATPSVLVIDDLHWADQATTDLLRYILRRIGRTPSMVIAMARDDELPRAEHLRTFFGDLARSSDAFNLELAPLTVEMVGLLAQGRPVDVPRLHRITGGNAFFVSEMLDHDGDDVPPTVRDALLARTVGLDAQGWDLLYLLACSPGPLSDEQLTGLGVSTEALRVVHEANLIRRTSRGIGFRHDLCRLAIASVIPPGAQPAVHRRMLAGYGLMADPDPVLVTHHALGAGDRPLTARAAGQAGAAAARSGAHTQAAEFFRIALESGGPHTPEGEAQLLEQLADEYYLIDRLGDAIAACRSALRIRMQLSEAEAVSGNYNSLAVYEWYNGDHAAAERYVAQAVSAFDGAADGHAGALTQLGHGFAMQAYLAVQASDMATARQRLSRARDVAERAGDDALDVRVALIDAYCRMLTGDPSGRETILALVGSAPEHLDEIYSSGYSNLSYFDVEYRRLVEAAEVLGRSLPLTVERDLPICYVWQLGSRSRMRLLQGNWQEAAVDAETVLAGPGAPLARTWPHLVRALVALRRDGSGAGDLDEAWQLAFRLGEPFRQLPVAAAVAEAMWLRGEPDARLEQCRSLLAESPSTGLEWSQGELAVWLRRLGLAVEPGDVAEPYRLLLDGAHQAAADAFDRLGTPYDSALALADSGDPALARRALNRLDRLGAAAVAARIRRDLRSAGVTDIPARPRVTTSSHGGLTARQLDVLRLLADGMTNAELARKLYLSVKTVDHHVSAVLAKLEADDRRQAVRRARELGIID